MQDPRGGGFIHHLFPFLPAHIAFQQRAFGAVGGKAFVPQPDTPVLTGGVSVQPAYTVRSARIFVSDILKVLSPELPLSSTILHVTYHGAGLTP